LTAPARSPPAGAKDGGEILYDLSAVQAELPIVQRPSIRALIDSGAAMSFVAESSVRRLKLPTTPLQSPVRIRTVSGEIIQLKRQSMLEDFGNVNVLVAPLDNGVDAILGFPWMAQTHAKFDYDRRSLICQINGSECEFSLDGMNAVQTISKKELKKDLKDGMVQGVFHVAIVSTGRQTEEAPERMHERSIHSELMELIRQYPDVFPEKPKLIGAPEPRLRLTQPAMRIDTGDAAPIKLPYYKMGPADQDELKRQLKELIDAKLVRPSISPWGAPVLFVTKKNGSKRLCIDYRALNRVTKTDAYPLPRIQESLDRLGKARIYTSLDATSGFWQNPVAEPDIPKTAFNTRYGSYEFTVTPFGLKNCPSAFQRMMDEILHGFLDEFVIVYVDDILIYSEDWSDHIMHVRKVAERLRDYGIQVNMEKSRFGQESLIYCGFVVKGGRIAMDPTKVAAVKDWPIPENASDVRSFLGFIGYYRRMIKDYGTLTAPLHNATGKEGFRWTELEQRSFEELKNAMIASPVLRCPDDALTFHIWPDASPWAVGGILTQDAGDGHQPIAYEYHKLSKAELNYPHHEKEILAMLHCLRKWRYYFEGRKLIVHSDSSTVVRMTTVKDPHRRLQRWINEYQYWSPDIIYEPGASNPADALSRLTLGQEGEEIKDPISEADVFGLYSTSMQEFTGDAFNRIEDWPLIIAYYLEKDEWPDESPELIDRCKTRVNEFEVFKGMFCHKEKSRGSIPYLPSKERPSTVRRYHRALGHLATGSILEILRNRFWWPDMPRSIQNILKACPECQMDQSNKRTHAKAPLKPLPSVALPFERWGMDFVQNLRTTKAGNRHIITAIDYATRWVVAKAVPDMTADTVAAFLYHDILMHYGAPYEIISDRGSSLLAESIKKYEEMQKISHRASTPYHPQTNGMVERMHATLGACITKLCESNADRWDEFLPAAVFALRARVHAVTKYSPFFLLYGVEPRIPGDTSPLRSGMVPLDELEQMEERAEFTARGLDELGQARAAALKKSEAQAVAMKRRYDLKHQTKKNFYEVNDMVKMKDHTSQKFEFEWKGPYHIVDYGIADETYYLMDPQGKRFDNAVAQDELAPWLMPMEPDTSFFYDKTHRPEKDEQPAEAIRFTGGQNDEYHARKRRIGVPIRAPRASR
jgi:transposase InsO family protein